MRRSLTATGIVLSVFVCSGAWGGTWYVDGSVGASGDGATWETAKKTIQEGIDAASDGDTVTVAQGTYYENIDFNGQKITLRSTQPEDSAAVARTVIDGGARDSVVRFSGSEDQTCVLSGFTIQNGLYTWGGGIFGSAGRATIQNNVIRNNRGTQGGGLAYGHGVVRNNVIADNEAVQEGGGLYCCHGEVENNTIVGNSARRGGGLYGYSGTIRNCIIWGNVAQIDEQVSGIVSPTYCCIQDWEGGGEGNISWFPYFVDTDVQDYHLRSWSPCIDAGDRSSDFSNEPEPNGRRINMGAYGNTPEATPASADSDGDMLPDEWEVHYFGGLDPVGSGDSDGDGVPNLEEYGMGTDPADYHWYVDGSVEVSGDGMSWKTAFKTIQEGINAASDGDAVVVAEETYVENIHFRGKNIVLRSTDPLDPDVVANTIIDAVKKSQSVISFDGTENETCVLSGFTIRNGKSEFGGGICGGTEDQHTLATIQNNVIIGNSAIEGGGGLARCDGIIENNTITANSVDTHFVRGGGGLCDCDGLIQNNVISDNRAACRGGGGLSGCDGTIRNNTVTGNGCQCSAGDGGGFLNCQGTIQANTITGNWAGAGGGLYECHGTIEENTIAGNSAYEGPWSMGSGGGLCRCDGTIENNAITGNSGGIGAGLCACNGIIGNNLIAVNLLGAGGPGGEGLAGCNGTIKNNTICHNEGVGVDGLYGHGLGEDVPCTAIIQNNTIVGNSVGLRFCIGTILNCIIWGNVEQELVDCAEPSYSCIQDWTGGGEGNIAMDPCFVALYNRDFHLGSLSPCIDAGDPSSDFSNEPQPNGGRINMGAYGNTPEATSKSEDSDSDGLPDDWEVDCFGDLSYDGAGDPDGDRILIATEYRYGWNPTMAAETLVENRTKGVGYETIQPALWECDDGDEIVVHPGVYDENVRFWGKNVVLTSTDPFDPLIVENTVIDGQGHDFVVRFFGSESESCVLSGFTIRNGRAWYGGGICGRRGSGDRTHATIQNNAITGNSANYGGGLYCCDGTVQNNTITGNSAVWSGGGLYSCHGAVQNNTISGNSAGSEGGGLYYCDGTVQNNVISNNSAERDGGGLYYCRGTIQNNTVYGNWAREQGGGLFNCDGAISNCIIWGNMAPQGAQLDRCSGPTYSCIQNWTGAGGGNTAENPGFLEPDNDDFRLLPSSLCIDAGKNEDWMWEAVDLDGSPRVLFGGYSVTVDMGAYEYYDETFDTSPPYVDERDPAPDATDVYINSNIVLHLKDDGHGVDEASIVMTVNGLEVTPTITGNPSDFTVTYDPPSHFELSQAVTVTIDAQDRCSPANVMVQVAYSFTTVPDDRIPPEITLSGEEYMTWELGTPYVDPGCAAEDDKDGDVTGNVQVTGMVDHTVAGCYVLRYNVSDAAGNPAEEKTRTVKVVKGFDVTQIAGGPPAPVGLIWESEVGATYTIWCCSDVGSGKWNEEATVPSQGEFTSWLDFNTSCLCKFYKIEIE